jgi:hypothetical protein
MIHDQCTATVRDIRAEDFAAELTSAAYPLVLRRGMKKSWIEVELGLWEGLVETVKTWARRRQPAASGVSEAWRIGLLGAVTASALSFALDSGIDRPRPDMESALYQALGRVIRTSSHVN